MVTVFWFNKLIQSSRSMSEIIFCYGGNVKRYNFLMSPTSTNFSLELYICEDGGWLICTPPHVSPQTAENVSTIYTGSSWLMSICLGLFYAQTLKGFIFLSCLSFGMWKMISICLILTTWLFVSLPLSMSLSFFHITRDVPEVSKPNLYWPSKKWMIRWFLF